MSQNTTVIYNAQCPICSREVASYRRYAVRQDLPIRFQGLGEADLEGLGLTEKSAAKRLHVTRDGELLAGVPAFIALWREMPRFRPLARVVALPGIRQLATLIYEAVLAPLLYALHRRRVRRSRAAG